VLCAGHRTIVVVVILVVVTVLVSAGQPLLDAVGIVLAAGGAAAQVSFWLSGQPLLTGLAGRA
jgi:hypothetical protein